MFRFAVLLVLTGTMVSCGVLHDLFKKPAKQEKKDEDKPRSVLVGRIASVASHGNFVLIQSYGKWEVQAGTALWSGDEEHMAALQVTGEKLGQFAAADIRSGTPTIGDAVYERKVPEHKDATPAAKPTSPQPAPAKTEPPANPQSGQKATHELPGIPKLPENQ